MNGKEGGLTIKPRSLFGGECGEGSGIQHATGPPVCNPRLLMWVGAAQEGGKFLDGDVTHET